jgi:hypothetical protein
MTTKKILYVVFVMMMGLVLAACERTKIGDVTADPGLFMNKEINVVGEVTQSIGASIGKFGQGVYQIDDGTGRLWVYANGRGVPSRGARVGVKGRIQQSVTFMGTNYATVMQESNRRAAGD